MIGAVLENPNVFESSPVCAVNSNIHRDGADRG